MTLTVPKIEMQEIEVEFPIFKKVNSSFYKGTSEKDWVRVAPVINEIMISDPYDMMNVVVDGQDITEDEFNAAFIKVFEKIAACHPKSNAKALHTNGQKVVY